MIRLRLAAILAAVVLSSAAFAHSFQKGGIAIGHPWTRATPGGATVGAGYVKITNTGAAPDRLMGGSFEGAESVEVHEMKMDGDRMSMRRLTGGVEIKPGETVELKPSSFHLMFLGLKKPIPQGPNIKGALVFEKAGAVDVEYKVEAIGAAESGGGHH